MQGQRILSLLVENCGRVHQGGNLDNQHKGEDKDDMQLFSVSALKLFNLVIIFVSQFFLLFLLPFFIAVFGGLVGDILLNHTPLQNFTIYSLDMKPSFIDRFVFIGN